MMSEESIASAVYTGGDLNSGSMDIREAGDAAYGIGEAVKKMLPHSCKAFREAQEFYIPIRFYEGSLHFEVPADIGTQMRVQLRSGSWLTADDFLFRHRESQQWRDPSEVNGAFAMADTFGLMRDLIRYVTFIGGFEHAPVNVVELPQKGNLVVVNNQDQEELLIPRRVIWTAHRCSRTVLSKMANVASGERQCAISVEGQRTVAIINKDNRNYFIKEEEELILPDLKDGDSFEGEASILAADEDKNILTISYRNYALKCQPESGALNYFKDNLISDGTRIFVPRVYIKGYILRRMRKNKPAWKPTIVIEELTKL